MALTVSQEQKIAELISAFDNGKRLTDLPEARGANPFDLVCEVLENGESKRAELAKFLPYAEDTCMYGVEKDMAVSTTDCTRIGNMSLHRTLPIQNRMKGCLLSDAGGVNGYLNPRDWTGNDRTGGSGQVMVEFPSLYIKHETEGTVIRTKISEFPLPGYRSLAATYGGAYKAVLQRSTQKLCSVVNTGVDFRGGNNNADWDALNKSFLGRSVSSLNRTQFRTYARNRFGGSVAGNMWLGRMQDLLYWMYVVEYANTNIQLPYNPQLTSEGYHQGGLGDGVSTLSDAEWNNFNGYNPFVPCGITDTLGNGTGVVPYTLKNADGTDLKTVYVPRYRGIELWETWTFTDDTNIRVSADVENGGDGLSKVMRCYDPSKFSDSGYDGYVHIGNEARGNGYVKELIFGDTGCIIASAVGGGNTTYFADYHYTNIPTSGDVLRGVLFGGSAVSGAYCGLAYASSGVAPSYSSAYVGSRLCYLPEFA